MDDIIKDIPENEFVSEILGIIRKTKDPKELAYLLSDYHGNDIAASLEYLTPNERKRLYSALGADAMSDIFSYLDDVGTYISELDDAFAADIIENMDADDAVDVLEELDEEKRSDLLELIEPEAKEDIELIHSYGEDEIGSIMTTNYIVIPNTLNIKQAMKALVEQAADNDNISTIYVTESDGETYYGAVDLKDLIIARQDVELESLIIASYPFVYDKDSVSENIEKLKGYSEDSIPVVTKDGNKLVGVITSQDIVEAVDTELGEDYARLAGLTEEEDLREPLGKSIKKRLPWLLALLVLGVAVSSVVGIFEGVVQQIALIVCFQSLILDMAGNVGTQSLAVTIRVITDNNLPFKDRLRLVLKEMRVGFTNGLILGLLSFALIGLYIFLFKADDVANPFVYSFSISACVGISLLAAMIVSSVVGTVTPLFFKRLGVDPAVASGPLITTVNDLVAIIIYYGMSWILLINVLGLAG